MRVSRGGDRAAAPRLSALPRAHSVPALADEPTRQKARGWGVRGAPRGRDRGAGDPPGLGQRSRRCPFSTTRHPVRGCQSQPRGGQSHIQALTPHPDPPLPPGRSLQELLCSNTPSCSSWLVRLRQGSFFADSLGFVPKKIHSSRAEGGLPCSFPKGLFLRVWLRLCTWEERHFYHKGKRCSTQ